MFSTKMKSILGTATVCTLAAASLSGCVVSDDPAINTLATVATVGVVSSLFYSNSDGFYYDDSYNRMPRGYRPAYNTRVYRVDNMDTYRRQHPVRSNMPAPMPDRRYNTPQPRYGQNVYQPQFQNRPQERGMMQPNRSMFPNMRQDRPAGNPPRGNSNNRFYRPGYGY